MFKDLQIALKFQIAFGAVLTTAVLSLAAKSAAIAFGFGALVSFLNLLSLVILWPWLLAKKLVALSIGAIVIKFAILAWILYGVASENWVQPGWFALGLATVIVTVIATSFQIGHGTPRGEPPDTGTPNQ